MRLLYKIILLFVFVLNALNGNAQISFRKAQEKYKLKKYNDAISVLDKLILKNDKDTQCYLLRGKCFLDLKQHQKAYKNFTAYLDLDPVDGLAYLYRGYIMESTEHFFDAINDYNAAVKYGKDTVPASACFHRGSCYLSVNNKVQAYNDLHTSYLRNSSDRKVCLNYGTALCKIDSIDNGILIFKQLMKQNNADDIACQNIAYFNMEKGEYDTALVYFNRALEINPKLGLVYNNRGFLKYKMGNNQEALKDINASLKLDKTNSYAYKNRALISISEGKIDDACEDLIKARSLGFAEKHGDEVNQLIEKHCKNR